MSLGWGLFFLAHIQCWLLKYWCLSHGWKCTSNNMEINFKHQNIISRWKAKIWYILVCIPTLKWLIELCRIGATGAQIWNLHFVLSAKIFQMADFEIGTTFRVLWPNRKLMIVYIDINQNHLWPRRTIYFINI